MVEHIQSGSQASKDHKFFSLLDTKSGRYIYVLEKYVQNIVRVGVEVSRDSKVLKMRDVQGYP